MVGNYNLVLLSLVVQSAYLTFVMPPYRGFHSLMLYYLEIIGVFTDFLHLAT